MQKHPTRIGLISDTHGLLRREALEALCGSELIFHAGDVGKQEILESLRELAPVVAVRGNVDMQEWARGLPSTAIVEAGAIRIYMLHDVKELDLNPAAAGFQIVISGHSHQPGKTERGGVWYIQPRQRGAAQISITSDDRVAPCRGRTVEPGVCRSKHAR